MVGEYPFVNGSSCKEHVDGEARLKVVLNAGVTAFASMLSELPAQKEMPIGGVNNYIPYKPTADLIAAGTLFSASHSIHEIVARIVLSKEHQKL